MANKIKFGINQMNKPTPRRSGLICNFISYLITGMATISWVMKYPDLPVILLLVAGGIDKFIKPMFGEETDFKV
jgi:hypothetical protein